MEWHLVEVTEKAAKRSSKHELLEEKLRDSKHQYRTQEDQWRESEWRYKEAEQWSDDNLAANEKLWKKVWILEK